MQVAAPTNEEHLIAADRRPSIQTGEVPMGKKDPRVDAYIAKAAPFAKPILTHLRDVIHSASPEIDEEMKWSFPHFTYKGIVASMAAFKEHASFGFWKSSLVLDKSTRSGDGMGSFGRLTSVADLPAKPVLVGYVKQAMKLNDAGVPSPTRSKPKPKPPVVVPKDLAAAIKKNKQAAATFEKLPPSHRREYVEWITEAKTDATRLKRLTTAIEWMSEGKARNWKYGAR
jgi:uncharacterized protein YdeI (YjbR/CyaY-like superfamily)